MQKTPFFFLLAILVILVANPVSADDSVVYNSGDLAINDWHFHYSKHTVKINNPQNGSIVITKRTPKQDIAWGFVAVNRRFIPLKRFLSGTDTVLIRNVKLRQMNRIIVFLIGSPGASVLLTVHAGNGDTPPPTVTLTADPETIPTGSGSTLSWTSEYADSCVIKPDIGAIDTNGSILVSPTATTTYTITATGSGGSASSSTTITVNSPVPLVTLSAEPLELVYGESTTLTWSSEYADECTIDPNIGSVDTNGSISVSPDETTTYQITASGAGGASTASITVTVTVNPIALSIISPVHMQHISRHDVLVEGTVSNTNDTETGVVVNDVPAMVFDGRFVANHIPLVEGENTITVQATDADGNFAEETIIVFAEIAKDYISLSADAESGVTFLETILRVNGPLNFLTPSITFTGPGGIDFMDGTEENTYPIRMSQTGIYHFTVEVTDDQSEVFSDTVAIVVMSSEALDELLKAKWTKMKTALIDKDIEKALKFHHDRTHGKFDAIYNALGDDLPALVSQMQEISQICYRDGVAKYRIGQDHDINGQPVTITYYIYYSRGENGLWLVEKY